jgi:uncharacterized membrane protein
MTDPRINVQAAGDPAEFSLTLKRNCSMSPQALVWLLVFTACLSFAIGIGFALFGAWPVLPFVGIEVLALAIAFHAYARHALDYEQIRLKEGTLEVEVCDGERRTAHRLDPAWVRVVARSGSGIHRGELRLALRSHGNEIEIGRHLDAPGRRVLAAELRGRLERLA